MIRWNSLLAISQLACLGATTWHVAPQGRDTNPGTADAPFATLERARDAVRAARATDGATVEIHAGTYVRSESFKLGPQDSGSATAPVVWRALSRHHGTAVRSQPGRSGKGARSSQYRLRTLYNQR